MSGSRVLLLGAGELGTFVVAASTREPPGPLGASVTAIALGTTAPPSTVDGLPGPLGSPDIAFVVAELGLERGPDLPALVRVAAATGARVVVIATKPTRRAGDAAAHRAFEELGALRRRVAVLAVLPGETPGDDGGPEDPGRRVDEVVACARAILKVHEAGAPGRALKLTDLRSTLSGASRHMRAAPAGDDWLVAAELETGVPGEPSSFRRWPGDAVHRSRGGEADHQAAPRQPEVRPIEDSVRFTVTAPAAVAPGAFFLVDLWAHLEAQRDTVIERAREAAPGQEISLRTKGATLIARGSVLTARITCGAGLQVEADDAEDRLLWDGDIAQTSFPVFAPADTPVGTVLGSIDVLVDGVRIARVRFHLTVRRGPATVESVPSETSRHARGFASYASEDRDEVLARVQGIQKVAPDLDVFLDVLTLRAGQRWAEELERAVSTSDVFYLFWSSSARASPWVEKEWRWALSHRGPDFIDPVPLQTPEISPPPPELAHLHFNDWTLAFRSRS